MSEPADLQSALSLHLEHYRQTHRLTARQRQVCEHIVHCRTPTMGGALLRCDHCDHGQPHYFACRDRHCPRCQRRASAAWCERQRSALLPVTYHHLVFTLPHTLNGWFELHPALLYHLLFQCAWGTLSCFGADPKRLDGELGMTAVLHTWGENLSRHVHLHCLVPGGALGADGQWHPAKSTYLFPVRALSRHFRGKMVSALRARAEHGELHRVAPGEIDTVLDALMASDWAVYSTPCPTHTGTVVDYLGRYSHRIAISDHRIVAVDGDRPVQGLQRRRAAQDHGARRLRVHPALPASRAAEGVDANPSLWPAGQSMPAHQARAGSDVSRRGQGTQ